MNFVHKSEVDFPPSQWMIQLLTIILWIYFIESQIYLTTLNMNEITKVPKENKALLEEEKDNSDNRMWKNTLIGLVFVSNDNRLWI